jgi:hypothetical protein
MSGIYFVIYSLFPYIPNYIFMKLKHVLCIIWIAPLHVKQPAVINCITFNEFTLTRILRILKKNITRRDFPITINAIIELTICLPAWLRTTKYRIKDATSDRANNPQRRSTCFGFYCLLPSLPAAWVSSYIALQGITTGRTKCVI